MSEWICEKCNGISVPLLDESGEVKKLFCGVCVKVHIAIPRAELEELVAELEQASRYLSMKAVDPLYKTDDGYAANQTAAKFREKHLKP